MFSGKLIIVLLVLGTAADKPRGVDEAQGDGLARLSQRSATDKQESQQAHAMEDDVENDEYCGLPAGGRNCQNYTSVQQLFNNPEITDFGSRMRVLRQMQLEDICRDFTAAAECVRDAILEQLERCSNRDEMSMALEWAESYVATWNYLCIDEIENIETHRECFTDNVVAFRATTCFEWFGRRTRDGQSSCEAEELIQCASAGIDETPACKEGAKEVFERILTRLNNDMYPVCPGPGPEPNGPSASIFKFFK